MLRNSSGRLPARFAVSARNLVRALNAWPALFLLTSAFGQTALNLATQSRNADFSSFPFTRPVAVGTSVPSACQVGQLFFENTAPAGQNLFGCTASNSWTLLGGIGTSYTFAPPLTQNGNTVSIPQATTSVNGFLAHTDWNTFNAKQPAGNYLTALTGDLTAAGPGSATATLATVNGAPGSCGDASHICQLVTNGKGLVTSQASVAITAGGTGTVTHTAGALTSGKLVIGNGGADVTVGDLSGDVSTSGSTTVTLATVNSAPGACGDAAHVCQVTTNGKGLVTSQTAVAITAGGTGTVTHTAGALTSGKLVIGNGGADVTVGDLSGDVSTSGSTTVTLATVNSAPGACGDAAHVCQVTTNGKGLVTSQTAVAISGGSGTTVAVQNAGTAIGNASTINFSSGLAASFSGSTATITATGGGSSGFSTTLTNYLVTNSSGTLIIQAGVQASVYPSSSGTDVAYIYIDSNGTLTVADNTVALACTSCTAATGITAFPAGSKPIAVWNLTGSAFTTQAQDFSRVGPPASSSASCITGQTADGTGTGTQYHYVCVASNTWQRVALASF